MGLHVLPSSSFVRILSFCLSPAFCGHRKYPSWWRPDIYIWSLAAAVNVVVWYWDDWRKVRKFETRGNQTAGDMACMWWPAERSAFFRSDRNATCIEKKNAAAAELRVQYWRQHRTGNIMEIVAEYVSAVCGGVGWDILARAFLAPLLPCTFPCCADIDGYLTVDHIR